MLFRSLVKVASLAPPPPEAPVKPPPVRPPADHEPLVIVKVRPLPELSITEPPEPALKLYEAMGVGSDGGAGVHVPLCGALLASVI